MDQTVVPGAQIRPPDYTTKSQVEMALDPRRLVQRSKLISTAMERVEKRAKMNLEDIENERYLGVFVYFRFLRRVR